MITVNYCSCQLRMWCLLKKQMLFQTPVLTVTKNNIKLILDFQKDVNVNKTLKFINTTLRVFPPACHAWSSSQLHLPTPLVAKFHGFSRSPRGQKIEKSGTSEFHLDQNLQILDLQTLQSIQSKFDENPSSMLGLSHLGSIDLTGHPSYFYQKWPHGGIKSDICNPWLLSFLNHVSIMPWVSGVNFDLCFFFRRYEADPNTINTHPPFSTIRMAQNHFIEDFDVTFSVSWSIRHFIPQVFIS